jgi:predicted DNA binding CopG/RHH family protein
MADDPKIEGTPEAWESRDLGQDEKFVKISDDIKQDAIDESLELQMISIRLQKPLIDDLKMIAKLHGLGYQPLIRQILTRFVDCEKKQLLKQQYEEAKKAENQTNDPSAAA